MSSDESPASPTAAPAAESSPVRRAYEPPRIVWQEPYAPMSFGVSCAKQPGNPGCGPGPFSG